jgi:hypothetical protein
MLERIEERNRAVWDGHTRTFEDVTHTIGGMGLGFLLCSAIGDRARPLGYALVFASFLLHVYAYVTSPANAAERTLGRRW